MTTSRFLHRPIFGGVFGTGRYALASMPCVVKGLHALRFMVIEPSTGAVLSLADDKVAALDAARDVIRTTQVLAIERAEASGRDRRQAELWPGEDEIDNLVAACAPCNLSKGDRTALEFVAGQKR